ncbi:MAG: polysaccharide deacetylase family protein [Pseudomonadota bacterium]
MTDVLEIYEPARTIAAKLKRRVTQWRAARPATLSFERPVMSICFDDFTHDAATNGARILERRRARGTFYASAGLADRDTPSGRGFVADDLARLHEAGHEIGCHTFAHDDCAQATVYDALVDLTRNRDALAAMGHTAPLRSLAYPYGETSLDLKASLPPRYRCARGILPRLNVGHVDLAQLGAYPMFGPHAVARLDRALERAVEKNGWVIAFTHDVSDAPSPWGTSCGDLDALLVRAIEAGFVIAPVNDALAMAQR